MTVPSSANASELAEYMHGSLRRLAAMLSYDVGTSYDMAIMEALIAYGVTDISQATNIPKLYKLARREALRMAVTDLSPRTDVVEDGRDIARSQAYKQANELLIRAENACIGLDTSDAQGSRSIVNIRDPYLRR